MWHSNSDKTLVAYRVGSPDFVMFMERLDAAVHKVHEIRDRRRKDAGEALANSANQLKLKRWHITPEEAYSRFYTGKLSPSLGVHLMANHADQYGGDILAVHREFINLYSRETTVTVTLDFLEDLRSLLND